MSRRPLISLTEAVKLYGADKVCFPRPRFAPEGRCEWCGGEITSKRRSSCCCKEHSEAFNIATSPVYYANQGSVGGYRGHILRRDNFSCQKCGELHVKYSPYDVPLPTTDGELDVHHKIRVADGGDDSPENLVTLCRKCHKEIHREESTI